MAPGIRDLRFNDPRRIDFVRDGMQLFFSPSLQPTPTLTARADEFNANLKKEFVLAPGGTTDLDCGSRCSTKRTAELCTALGGVAGGGSCCSACVTTP